MTFVVNDDIDAAVELGADGVHLGQRDRGRGSCARRGLLLGRSVSTLGQALGADADYLGAGPVWESPSKRDADPPIGIGGLAAICAATSIPVIAIGGDRRVERVAECIRVGAAGVAVDPRRDRSRAAEGGR